MPAISISLKTELISELEAEANSTGFSKSKIVENALQMYLFEKEKKRAASNQ